jgi:YebC/PmpR family DNA-binding regulatory protein
MAGHSHWAKIKRAKGATDKKRATVWSKISRKIIIAAKNGGDPRDNLALRYVIEEAKACNMTRDTIQNAIKKGTGELGGENYSAKTYEGYGPSGVAIMIEALTNNPARTAPDLRAIFERNGGNLATTGSVAFQFNKRGIITIKADAVSEDRLMEVALDAGAEDVTGEGGEVFEVLTSPVAFQKVRDAIAAAEIPIEGADIAHVPTTTVAVDADTAATVLKLIDALDDNDDVQTVAHNAELPEEAGV